MWPQNRPESQCVFQSLKWNKNKINTHLGICTAVLRLHSSLKEKEEWTWSIFRLAVPQRLFLHGFELLARSSTEPQQSRDVWAAPVWLHSATCYRLCTCQGWGLCSEHLREMAQGWLGWHTEHHSPRRSMFLLTEWAVRASCELEQEESWKVIYISKHHLLDG